MSSNMPQAMMTRLAPFCERIELTGAARRGVQSPLIELLAIPKMEALPTQASLVKETVPQYKNLLWERLDKAKGDEAITDCYPWFREKRGFVVPSKRGGGTEYCIYVTNPACWGTAMVWLTGEDEFLRELTRPVTSGGLMAEAAWVSNGYLVISGASGESVACPEEADVFKAFGCPFIPAQDRQDGRWRKVAEEVTQ